MEIKEFGINGAQEHFQAELTESVSQIGLS